PGLKPEALKAGRVGIGHPEGYQEAFAVLYAEAAEAIVARRLGEKVTVPPDMPTVEDGLQTMRLIEAALQPSRTGSWVACRPSCACGRCAGRAPRPGGRDPRPGRRDGWGRN